MPDITLPNLPLSRAEVFIKMTLFDPEVHLSIKGRNVAGTQEGGRKIYECYSETNKNKSWGMLAGEQRRVTSLQRLKQPMK
jgi:hypothetical protein